MGHSDDLKKMKEKAEAVQSIFSEVKNLREAFQHSIQITKSQGGSSIAAPGLTEVEAAELRGLCDENGLTLITDGLRDHIGSIHTGFTRADWGIAETATLVLDSTREDTRIATMLSETHVALLPASKLKPDAMSLERELSGVMAEAPRYLAFISGASRTADIERVLTIGVHGPQELHILVLEDFQS